MKISPAPIQHQAYNYSNQPLIQLEQQRAEDTSEEVPEEEPEYVYKYKGHIPIGVLRLVDDLAGISESGMKAVQ